MPPYVPIDALEHTVVQNNDVVVPALPRSADRRRPYPVHFASDPGPVRSNDATQRSGCWPQRTLTARWVNSRSAGLIRQFNNAMDMVGHDRECVDLDMSIVPRNAMPVFVRDPPIRVHYHAAIHDLPEQWLAIVRAECHEVQARQRVIVGALTDTAAMVSIGVENVSAVHDVENTGLYECPSMRAT